MAYEPKVGDEVFLRGQVMETGQGAVMPRRPSGGLLWVRQADVEPVPDLGEAEMRGDVTGPWAVTLSEAMEKVERRVAEIEASAKVRDVPATMVNLASRVQALEVTVKTLMEDAREKDARVAAELDGVLVRVGRLEEFAKPRASFVEKFPAADAAPPVAQTITGDNRSRGTIWAWADADEIRDAQGRVLKSKTQDVDPQADWSTARVAGPPPTDPEKEALHLVLEINQHLREQVSAAQKMTEQIRSVNHNLIADVQRAEARVKRCYEGLAATRVDQTRSEFHRGWAACTDMALASLVADPYKGPLAQKDPAHGAHAQASE